MGTRWRQLRAALRQGVGLLACVVSRQHVPRSVVRRGPGWRLAHLDHLSSLLARAWDVASTTSLVWAS